MAYDNPPYYQGMRGGMGQGMNQNMGYQTQNTYNTGYNQVRPTPQQPQQSYIQGRMVQQESEILPNEVPMDGNYATFISQDMKNIFMKTWGVDGNVHTEYFTNVTDQVRNGNVISPENSQMNAIMERLDNIEKYLKRSTYRPKKQYDKRGNSQNNKED